MRLIRIRRSLPNTARWEDLIDDWDPYLADISRRFSPFLDWPAYAYNYVRYGRWSYFWMKVKTYDGDIFFYTEIEGIDGYKEIKVYYLGNKAQQHPNLDFYNYPVRK
jgi:hypothetical protein